MSKENNPLENGILIVSGTFYQYSGGDDKLSKKKFMELLTKGNC